MQVQQLTDDVAIINQDFPLTDEEFDKFFSRVTRMTVDLVIQNEDGLLLAKRNIEPCKGQWHIPGGTVRHGELIQEAVRRIELQELGVELKAGKPLGYLEYPRMVAGGYPGWPISIVLEASITGGDVTDTAHTEQVEYFTQIPDNTIEDQKAFLEQKLGLNPSTKKSDFYDGSFA